MSEAREIAEKLVTDMQGDWGMAFMGTDEPDAQSTERSAWVERIAAVTSAAHAAGRREMKLEAANIADQHNDWRWLAETYPEFKGGAPTEAAQGAGLVADAILALPDEPAGQEDKT